MGSVGRHPATDVQTASGVFNEGRGRNGEWECDISADEEDLIIRLHRLLGDRWSLIAGRLPWRKAEEIEKYWKIRSQKSDFSG